MEGFWVVRPTTNLWWIGPHTPSPNEIYTGAPEILGQDGKEFLEPDAKPFETRREARLWIEACKTYGYRSWVRSTDWVLVRLTGSALTETP